MFDTPRNHGCVSGTGTIAGTGITSLTRCNATNQLSDPTWKPSLDASAARVAAVRSFSLTESWNSRSPERLTIALPERLDLFEQLGLVERLGHVVLRALAKAPDLVGLLVLGRADDHRDMLGRLLARDRAGRLESVEAGHHHVHEDEIGLLALRALDRLFAAIDQQHLVAALFENALHERALGGRIVHHHYFLDGHFCVTPHRIDLFVFQARLRCARWTSTAFSRLSLVNGLVRYSSDPTMRPRARSKRLSLDDSMITGVALCLPLFLMTAHV